MSVKSLVEGQVQAMLREIILSNFQFSYLEKQFSLEAEDETRSARDFESLTFFSISCFNRL